MTRAETWEREKVCVCADRETDYGSTDKNFKRITEL